MNQIIAVGFILAVIFGLGGFVFFFKEPDPPPVPSDQARNWLYTFYRSAPAASEWQVTRIANEPGRAVVSVEPPPAQAEMLESQSPEQRAQMLGELCPSKGQAIWKTLKEDQTVIVSSAFGEVDCRAR